MFELGLSEGGCDIGAAMLEDAKAGVASRHRVPRRKMWYVNVYEVDRAYGGPEEGGWYYSTGVPTGESEAYFTEAFAWHRARILDEEHREGRSKVYSVNYRGGAYEVRVQDHPGKAYPEETPHYE
ncbi:hypothetical protein AB0F25_30420 [Streptomyces wedmorensis]|uniref:hypothetical protein n=1 Tax=Streptomyces wedmorensis TaxID=43759 RepID=UPI003447DF0E